MVSTLVKMQTWQNEKSATFSQMVITLFQTLVLADPPVDPGINKAYLDNKVFPTLTQGLTHLCKEKPLNPVKFLGDWLLQNNPNVPRVAEPAEKGNTQQ